MRSGKQFKSHHNFSHLRPAQKERIKMNMEMPFTMHFPIRRLLVKTHCVRKRNLEQIVVARGYLLEDIGKVILCLIREIWKRSQMALAHNQDLERPNGPERNDGLEPLVRTNQTLLKLQFQS